MGMRVTAGSTKRRSIVAEATVAPATLAAKVIAQGGGTA